MSKNLAPKTLTFSLELVNALANYLGTRPHNEVDQLVQQVRIEVQPQLKQHQLQQDEVAPQPEPQQENEEKVAAQA